MKRKPARLDFILAWLLNSGTGIASALLTIWLLCTFLGQNLAIPLPFGFGNLSLVTAGIAVIILLPVLRIITMLVAFLTKREYQFAAIAALVLLIIVCAFALGATAA
ncbi:uncharacterized protein DUF1634 [Thermosporothrix hazakensis]|jgi:uncharacterized membrane protein|uniref:Uncharacterized protein DUF1634 n=2 Tax=Thermosporothrix TaxID=768650 RepID=A0A326UB22_THEHA|nr:DUF1634 domain-containing protein [Thermosporothrix hazakensis]PZW32575.1 uncharacterized protein DUF1634 [Thermosporothrix hazakensis]BBH87470.1 hypothetical protein KTC_22210 [Thermosporothrix sp. COM3]GCE49927.1 hypothetical protein KTH_47960 [Thermosporothrix hazakensis]